MASSSSVSRKKKNEKEEGRPHFFKIILPDDSTSQHKLGIPPKFVQIYGGFLSSPVTLKVPSASGGVKWKVEIVKNDGDIWLRNGWREFAEYYSVVEGSFLVFEFVKSTSEFNVLIFDKTASEIDYPVDLDQEQVHQQPRKKNKKIKLECFNVQSENPSFKIVMQPSFLLKRAALVIPPSFARNYLNENGVAVFKVFDGTTWFVNYYSRKASPITKTRIEHSGWEKFVIDNHLEVGDVCIFELIDPAQTTFRVTISKYSNAANLLRTSLGNGKQSLEKGSRSKERKVSFSNPRDAKELSNKITSTNPSFRAKISSASLRSCIVHVPASFIMSIKRDTKYAKLKVNNRCWPVKLIISQQTVQGQLSAGWSAFARENSLESGDVCIFELIDNTDHTLLINVSIMRDSGRCLVTNGVGREVIKPQVPKVEDTKTEIPDEVFGKFSSSRKRKEKSALSSSQPRKKAKNVENFTNETRKGKNKQPMRKENGAKECICLGKPSFANPRDAAKKYSTKNPFFEVAMTRSHVKEGGTLYVPRNFMKNLELVTQTAQLQVDNRIWSLKLNNYPHHGQKNMFSGWVRFAKANSLKVGDVCSFELIDTQNLVIKVSINRQ